MGTRAEELRQEIARERWELGESMEAVGDRVSPGRIVERRTNRMRDRVSSVREAVMGSTHTVTSTTSHAGSGAVDTLTGAASSAAAGVAELAGTAGAAVTSAPHAATESARGNPLAAGLVAFGAGMLAAAVFPATRKEAELAGTAREAARPALDQAKEVAKEAATHLQSTAEEAAQQVKETAVESVHEVRDAAADAARTTAQAGSHAVHEVQSEVRPTEPPATPPPSGSPMPGS